MGTRKQEGPDDAYGTGEIIMSRHTARLPEPTESHNWCHGCRHELISIHDTPCENCVSHSKFEPKEAA